MLLKLYNYLAERWISARETRSNVLRHRAAGAARHERPRLAGRWCAGLELMEAAQTRWRMLSAPHLVALVGAGATFESGTFVDRPDESGDDQLGACTPLQRS